MIESTVITLTLRSRVRWPRIADMQVTTMTAAMAMDSAPRPVELPHHRLKVNTTA